MPYWGGYGGFGGFGGFDWDDGNYGDPDMKQPKFVEAAIAGDLTKAKRHVTTAKKKSEKAVRILINHTQKYEESEDKAGGMYTKEWYWHRLTALAEAARNGHFPMVHFLLSNNADPTLEGCYQDNEYADVYKAATLCRNTHPDKQRIIDMLEAVRPFWNQAKYHSSSWDDDRKKKGYPNAPTDPDALLTALAEFAPAPARRGGASGGAAAKKSAAAAADVSTINLEKEAKAGKLSKMTVPVLKACIKKEGITTKATKKADLIDTINMFYDIGGATKENQENVLWEGKPVDQIAEFHPYGP